MSGNVIAVIMSKTGASDTGSLKLGTTPGGGVMAGTCDRSILKKMAMLPFGFYCEVSER